MRLLLLFSVSLLWLASPPARAQSADDYFNGGAQAYISNNIPQALTSVETGLKQYPDDVKLKKLYELLKQQSQQQSQQQSKSSQNQQSQNQPPSSQNSQSQKPNEPNPSNPNNHGQQNQPPPQRSDEPQGGGKPENQDGQGQPLAAGQMTPEEARRLLDAQKGDEQFLQLKPVGKPQNPQQPIKDW